MTPEEKLILSNQAWLKMLLGIVKAVEEKYGQEGREVIDNALYQTGKELSAKFRDQLEITGEEPMDYARLHYYQDTNLWAIKEEVVHGESGEAIIRASFCPARGMITPRDCTVFLPYVRGALDVINPSLKWQANKVLTKGDDCCEFIVTKD